MSLLLVLQGAIPAVTGSGASVVGFTDAGVALEIFVGTGASAVRFVDAGAGLEAFFGSGASVVVFTDGGVGVVITPITGSGASFLIFGDSGQGSIPEEPSSGGGGGGGFVWQWKPNQKKQPVVHGKKRSKKKVVPALLYRGHEDEPRLPRVVIDLTPLPLDTALFTGFMGAVNAASDPQRARARVRARWYAAHAITGAGGSVIRFKSLGRGKVVPADVMSLLRLLVDFQET